MNTFESKFILDKKHFTECYEQSLEYAPKRKFRYSKCLLLVCFGMFIYMMQIEKLSGHLGAFFFILAFIEALSVKYAQAWWVTRQMWSKASNSEVILTVDDEGINTKTDFSEVKILWKDIVEHKLSSKGIILLQENGANSYISEQNVSAEAWSFMLSELKAS
ncbi:hypothetical protein [Thalassotalea crassostreae]|uniref:hypothetical protein n=1 Tax=Thalassotalea crassostreae TaxID=1763536 RepID=UPI000838004B|nr:hypothetical protein [Thalassotalea crassostreae]